MDRVKSQAAVVSRLLFAPETASSYQKVLVLTGQILKEVALLLWLLICSIFVLIAWIGETAISSGQSARDWWQAQQNSSADGNQTAAATGKAILDVSQNGVGFLLNQAREQLGLEKKEIEKPTKPASPAPKPAVTPAPEKPVAVAPEKSVAAAPAAPAAKPQATEPAEPEETSTDKA